MIIEEKVLNVEGELQGEQIDMTIAEDALAKIMSILTDLYANPELAVLREYSTNAFDAHIEAGLDRPIEVTLPNPMSQYLVIRDYGAGLNAEGIRDVYSRYGVSTKSESNDQVGSFGLGCKSGLTYSDSFTVTGVKDGICTQVQVSRKEDGSGTMKILAEFETSEPSGVEIKIPTKSHNNFVQTAEHFFSFWTPGSVLLNGKAPKRVDGTWLSDNLLLTKDLDASYIVMGNVPYPMSDTNRYYNPHSVNNHAIVAFVEIGEVYPAPSREALQDSKRTQAVIEHIKGRVQSELDAAIERDIAAAPSFLEALHVRLDAEDMGYKKAVEYKGEEIPGEFFADSKTNKKDGKTIWTPMLTLKDQGRGKSTETIKSLPARTLPNVVWFTGFKDATITPYKRQKLSQWLTKHPEAEKAVGNRIGRANRHGHNGYLQRTIYVFVDKLPKSVKKWIDPKNVHSWDGPAAEKIERVVTQSGKVSGSYKAWTEDGHKDELLAQDIDLSKKIVYVDRHYESTAFASLLKTFHPDGFYYVPMGANRIAKFKRDFPQAVEAREYKASIAKDFLKNLTASQKLWIQYNGARVAQVLGQLDPAKLDDPYLRKIAKLKNITPSAEFRNQYSIVAQMDARVRIETPATIDNNYPLLTSGHHYGTLSETVKEHIYLYVNAVYAAEKETV